tara:strand:- start:495 stop:1118 length:624 start_codon:yes stop_codon:yes gene_type:complete
MSRQKSYYGADEITNNLYAFNNELMYSNGVEYIGLYHKYTTGEIYSQPSWNRNTSRKLITYENLNTDRYKYKQLNPDINVTFQSLILKPVSITSSDISRGFVIRYFIQKQNSKNIIEIDQSQFDKWKASQIDNIMYNAIKLPWYISGQKTDSSNGPVKLLGVVTKNLNQIKLATKRMPGISSKLSNPLEYYTDVDFITPTDINGLDS